MILATTDFTESALKIQKKTNYYSCFSAELKSGASSNFTSNNSEIIFQTPEKILYKTRLKGCNSNGRSYGFRILWVLDRTTETSYLLYAYPKYGTYGIPSTGDEFNLMLVQNLTLAIESGNLHSLDFDKKTVSFKLIENHKVLVTAELSESMDEEE